MLGSVISLAFSCLLVVNARAINSLTARDAKPDCKNYHTDFTKGISGWSEIAGATNWEVTKEGLELKLIAPPNYTEKIDTSTPNKLKYNTAEGEGPTFNASSYMQYGRFSATLKSAKTGGAITAIILIADDKDEIDFELLGKGHKENEQVQSNYFWGKNIVYGKNGASHDVSGGSISDSFHTYTVDWSPERIKWSVNGEIVRTKTRNETKGEYPSSPARVQIGLWDGSKESGTAEWAHGPIEWKTIKGPVTAVIKEVTIECDPEHNNVTN
ncbi:unnamed protein product [Rhizopus stolonifer]